MLTAIKKLIGKRSPLRLEYHRMRTLAACVLYRFPARKLRVIAVTGTDGKTTTVGMIAHILHSSGKSVGALSTAFFRIKDKTEWNTTEKTSPDPFVIQRFLRRIADAGCEFAVVEVSSHGLVQHRTDWIFPEVAGLTNVTSEHLDYHGTMEQYRLDKGLLFRKHLKRSGTAVLNAADATFASYRATTRAKTVTAYDCRNTDSFAQSASTILRSENARSEGFETLADLTVKSADREADSFALRLGVPGVFNVENALCAIGCAMAAGIEAKTAADALATFVNAPGRLERIDEGQNFSVFVDFTVTPAAFTNTLSALKKMKKAEANILVLTGSCGDRMKEKRPVIGKLCSELADTVVITDDEPYTEDPLKIIEEVWAGVDTNRCQALKIADREEAIATILSLAKKDDIVLLCGMGSYPSRWMKNGPVPWNEQEICRKHLRRLRTEK